MKFGISMLNRSENYRIYDDVLDIGDLYLGDEPSIGDIFRAMRNEYGRCTSKVYVDLHDGGVAQVGWTFEKREKYQDSEDTYLQETWITLYDEHEYVLKSRAHHIKVEV